MPRINPGGPWLLASPPPTVEQVTGHYLWPLQRLQLTRLEPQPPLADHHSRLFFGRSVAVQIGQPFFIWPATQRIDEPPAITWRDDYTALHRYRTGFQTVGQPYALIWNSKPDVRFEPEVVRQSDHSALNLYRVGFQTVGQPWDTWRAYQQPSFEPEQIIAPQVNFAAFRQYIPATAGPGQPWYLWPPIQITIDPEEKMFRENHDSSLYPFRPHQGFIPVPDLPTAAGGGSGYPVWVKHRKSLKKELDEIIARIGTFGEPLREAAREVVREQTLKDAPLARLSSPDFTAARRELSAVRVRVQDLEDAAREADDEEVLLLAD